jgi:phytoene dehydrogenase-like protein
MLDQSLFMRPIPSWSNHKTHIQRLYLGGNGVHGSGGISGASGRNKARVILKENKSQITACILKLSQFKAMITTYNIFARDLK